MKDLYLVTSALILNYKSLGDGYVMIKIIDEKTILYESIKLTGNSIRWSNASNLKINKKVSIILTLNNAQIYSLGYYTI